MGIFDPKVDTEVTYQQPVSTPDPGPSVGLAVAETAANILESLGRSSGGRGGQGGSSQEDFALTQFQNDIMKADAIRSYDPQGAERLERTAALNLQRNGGDLDANAKNTYSAITGRPGDELFFNREQLLEQRIMETPEYESAIVATYASDEDMSQEERHQLAMGRVARQQGQAQVLMDQNISWTEGKRDALSSVISDFELDVLGTLNVAAREGQIVPIDQVRTAEAQWSQVRSGLVRLRPEGVTDKQWSQIEDRITEVNAQFELLNAFSSQEGIEARLGADLTRAVYNHPDWSVGKKVLALDVAKDVISSGAMGSSEIMDMMDSLISIDTDVPVDDGTDVPVDETTGEPAGPPIPENLKTEIDRGDAENAFNKVRNTGRLLTRADPNKAAADPKYRDDFLTATTMSLSYLYKVGDSSRYMTGASLDEALGKNFFTALQKAGEAEPAKGRAVANIGVEALQKQQALVTGKIMSNLSGSAMRLDENMNIVLNTDVLEEKVPGRIISALQSGADEYYNGNLIRLFEDNGRRIPQSEEIMPYTQGIVGDTSLLRDQLDSQRSIDRNLQKMKGVRDSFLTDFDNYEGSQGVDTVDLDTSAQVSEQIESYRDVEPRGILEVAQSQLGLNENDQREAITAFLKEGGQNIDPSTTAWCAAFVNSTLKQAGLDGTDQLNARSFLDWGTEVTEPKVGDVVVLWRDNPESWKGHVGFFKGYDDNGDILILGGNQSDSVNVKSYSKDKLLGFRRPPGQQGTGEETIPKNLRKLATEPESFLPEGYDTVPQGDSGGGSASSIRGSDINVPVGTQVPATASPEGSREEATQSAEQDKESASKISEQQRNKVMRILKAQGVDTDAISKFNSVEAAQEAIDKGELKEGDLYEVNGEIEIVEEP